MLDILKTRSELMMCLRHVWWRLNNNWLITVQNSSHLLNSVFPFFKKETLHSQINSVWKI